MTLAMMVASGLRIGTPAVTTQGMTERDMATIASLIARALKGRDNPTDVETVRAEAAALCAAHPPYPELG